LRRSPSLTRMTRELRGVAGSRPLGGGRANCRLGWLRRDSTPHLRQLVDSIRADSGVTETIKSYSGTEVAIQGFIIPAGPPDLSFFLLSRVSALGNYCCEAPVGQDETVYVFTTKPVNITYDPLRIFKVVGVFEAGMRADAAYGPSLFRVRDARVEQAVGARMFKTGDFPASASKP
jgi:hypothetical protein